MTDAAVDTGAAASMTDEQIAAAFPGDDPAHVREMLARSAGEGKPVSPNADGDDDGAAAANADDDTVVYPDYIPEKFQTGTVEEAHAAMAKAHAELEAKLGAASDDDDADDNADDTNADDSTFNLEAVEAEFLRNDGVISDATYEAAEKAGMSEAVLDSYIAGQQAIAEQLVTRVHETAGGEENYSSMLTWATNNWAAAEVEAFDAVMETGNEMQIKLTVQGLKAAYEADQGRAPQLTKGDTGAPQTHGSYSSKAEMTAEMRDPRYKTDPAFRAKVAAKLSQSDIW